MKAAFFSRIKGWVFHHYLLAIIPILSVYQDNIVQLTPRYLFRPFWVSLLFSILIFLVFKYVTKDKDKSALMTSTLLFFIFYYAPIFFFLYRIFTIRLVLFFILWILLFTAIILFLGFTRKKLRHVNQFLNALTFILVLAIGVIIVQFEMAQARLTIPRNPGDLQVLDQKVDPSEQKKLPDIYYIILDGFGREDIIKDLYKLNVSQFREFLIDKGFYVATESHANYGQTMLSLASSLNLRYLDPLIQRMGPESKNRRPLMKMVEQSDLIYFLRRCGYKIFTFDSGYPGTIIREKATVLKQWDTLDEFESILINNSLLRGLLSKVNFRSHIKRIGFILDTLGKMAQINGPKVVFAHVLSPHPPFVFKANGKTVIPDTDFTFNDGNHFVYSQQTLLQYIIGYRNQVIFINNRLKSIINELLSTPGAKPIIILQGDHGPGSRLNHESIRLTNLRERLGILNAYYLPSQKYNNVYPSITPVNTFRIIIGEYFNKPLKRLMDRSYYMRWSRPYHAVEIKVTKSPSQKIPPLPFRPPQK
jgi:hypothetical protein